MAEDTPNPDGLVFLVGGGILVLGAAALYHMLKTSTSQGNGESEVCTSVGTAPRAETGSSSTYRAPGRDEALRLARQAI